MSAASSPAMFDATWWRKFRMTSLSGPIPPCRPIRVTPFAHWLSRIALRSCYDAWRSVAGRKELPLSSLGEEHQQWAERLLATESHERFEELVRQQETTELLHRALAQLSPENRMVVTLVHLEGHSVREAAERLGWSVINVKVRAHRARQQLRQILEGLIKDTP